MPLQRIPLSKSQLCELLGVEPEQFIDVERQQPAREGQRNGQSVGWQIVMEAEEMAQASGVFPQLNQGKGGKKGGGKKKGC